MKKILFLMFTVLAIGSNVYGADQLKVDDKVYLRNTGTTDFVVFFNSDAMSSVSGVNFWIKLPNGVEFVTDAGSPVYKNGTTFNVTPTLNIVDGVLKVAMGSDSPIKGSHGMLIAFKIKPSSSFSAAVGDVLSGGKIYEASESKNGKVDLADYEFSINVTNRVVLDENSPFDVTITGEQNVLVKRTLKADHWSTLYLPFSVTDINVLTTSLNCTAKYAKFSGWESEDPTNEINVSFTTVNDYLFANTPYLIWVSSDVNEFSLDNVSFGSIDGYSSNPVTINNTNISSGTAPFLKYAKGTMTGTLNLHAMGANELFIQDNTFYYSRAGQNIKGFRATFMFKDPNGNDYLLPDLGTAGTRAMFSVDGRSIGDGTTGIDSYKALPKNGKVYSLTGNYMGEKETLKSLPKGVYIVDGIKIVNQ